MKREIGDYLQDIIEAIDKAAIFVKNMTMRNSSVTIRLFLR